MKSKLILLGYMAMGGFFLSSCVSLGIAMEKLIDAKMRAKAMRTKAKTNVSATHEKHDAK